MMSFLTFNESRYKALIVRVKFYVAHHARYARKLFVRVRAFAHARNVFMILVRV